MSGISRAIASLGGRSRQERLKIAAMAALFFTVLCAVGIVKPIKNAFALDGLGASRFYQVYFIGVVVVLFVPLFNRLSRYVEWRVLIPGLAIFFALDLVAFRVFYQAGSATFGMVFYAWYDLFTAALVTQFFAAAQLVFDASQAKSAFPLVIAGGSIGATVGGAVTGFLAQLVGTPQLLLVAAAIIVVFGLSLPLVLREGGVGAHKATAREEAQLSVGEFRRVFSNRHVQLLALMVLITIVVKTMVDFEFNAVSRQVFVTVNAISAFQGKFNAVTQWLPLLVLFALRPLLPRVGMGLAVFLLPVTMLAVALGLILFWGLWAASAAKGSDAAFRYSAERTGREILYVPIPDEIKIKAKLYIDMAIEKGLGKVLAGVLIMGVLTVISLRQIPFVVLGIVGVWLVVAVRIKREYVRSLVSAIRGRYASLEGLFASLTDASTLPVVRKALVEGDDLQTAFALDLVERAASEDVERFAEPLNQLLGHPSGEIRERALVLLGRAPEVVDPEAARRLLGDPSPDVRRLAAGILAARSGEGAERVLEELLSSSDAPTRVAALGWLADHSADGRERGGSAGETGATAPAALDRAAVLRLGRGHLERIHTSLADTDGGPQGRLEEALVADVLGDEPDAAPILSTLLDDPDVGVRSAALLGAGGARRAELVPRVADALADPAVRSAARAALVEIGDPAVPVLTARLDDEEVPVLVRRHVPSALADIPTQASFDALLTEYLAPDTDQLLDYRALKALNKMHAREPDLVVNQEMVGACLERELEAIHRYASAAAHLDRALGGERGQLLVRALHEARAGRRECAFRCLSLLYPATVIHRCYLTLSTGDRRARGNALELLEQTVGRPLFRRLREAVDGKKEAARSPAAGAAAGPGRSAGGGRSGSVEDGVPDELKELVGDKDRWVGRCARAALCEWEESRTGPQGGAGSGERKEPEEGMDAIEKVFLLQRVDVLREARTSELAMIAAISREMDVDEGAELLRKGEPPDALYVIIRGEVALDGTGEEMVLRDGTAFGTWALIDDSPSLVDARAREPTRLLRVGRAEFQDLLADNPEFGIDLLQGLARRVRALAGA